VDGRIDGEAIEAVIREGEYEATADTGSWEADAWICGARRWPRRHFAETRLISLPVHPGNDYQLAA